MATLEGQTIAGSYKDLLQVSNSNSGVDGTLRSIEDGEGTASVLKISSSAVEITDGAYDFDVASHDGTNGLKLGGTLVTSSATELNLLNGITTLSGSNTGDQATGISNGNVLVANAAVADNDFLKIDGTSVEGRTVAEVLSDLSVESGADVTDTTNVTAAGALMDSEVTNLATVKALATGISDGNFLTANAAVADNDFLRIDGTEVEGRTAAEVAADIEGSIDAVGTLASGAISSGFGNIDIGSSTFDTTGAVATGTLTVGGNIDFNSGTIDTSTQTVTVELNQAADSFTFDGASDNILSIDASNNRVGIGTATPATLLEVEQDQNARTTLSVDNNTAGTAAAGALSISADAADMLLWTGSSSFTTSSWYKQDGVLLLASGASGGFVIGCDDGSADISFWTNSTQKVTIDGSSGNVGIGTDAPAAILHVKGAESKIVMEETDADKTALISSGDGDFLIQANSGVSNDNRLIVYKTSADVTVSAGNLVIGTNGKGIDFSANTSDAGGMTAEILDDYEEGTWDAVVTDGSNPMAMHASYDTGYYTKVGNLVTVSGLFITTSLDGGSGNATGNIVIAGLPFTVTNNAAAYSAVSVGYADGYDLAAAGQTVGFYGAINTTDISLTVWDATTGTTAMQASEWSANGQCMLGFSYRAA